MALKRYGQTLRDAKGRFAGSIGGAKKPRSTRRRKKANTSLNQSRSLVSDVRASVAVSNERKRLNDMVSPKARKRLAQLALQQPSKPVTPQTKALNRKLDKATLDARKKIADRLKQQAAKQQAAQQKGKAKDANADGKEKAKKKKAFTSKVDKRIPADARSAQIVDGRVAIWANTNSNIPKNGFKVEKDKSHSYGVTVEGKQVKLNEHKETATYGGEKIQGLTRIHKYDKDTTNEKLIGDLHTNIGYVESWDKKGVAVPAPFADKRDWKQPEGYEGKRGLGQLQLHHVSQWYKEDVVKIRDDVDSGRITLDEAKAKMRTMLRPNEKLSTKYEIDLADQSKRAYVVLPAGIHDFSSHPKIYEANHPMAIHPDSGKLERFGIPDKSKGSDFGTVNGRQYHDKVRDGFWSELRRHEVMHVMKPEIDRRLANGSLTPEEFDKLWSDRVAKAAKPKVQ